MNCLIDDRATVHNYELLNLNPLCEVYELSWLLLWFWQYMSCLVAVFFFNWCIQVEQNLLLVGNYSVYLFCKWKCTYVVIYVFVISVVHLVIMLLVLVFFFLKLASHSTGWIISCNLSHLGIILYVLSKLVNGVILLTISSLQFSVIYFSRITWHWYYIC